MWPRVLDWCCAAVLICMAGTKLLFPAGTGAGSTLPTWASSLVAVVELLLAAMFVFRYAVRQATFGMIGLGLIFSIVQLGSTTAGRPCGCLGTVVTSNAGIAIVAGLVLAMGGLRLAATEEKAPAAS
jgi:hypothetical protein